MTKMLAVPDTLYDALLTMADSDGRSVESVAAEALKRYLSDDPEFDGVVEETLANHRTVLDRLADS